MGSLKDSSLPRCKDISAGVLSLGLFFQPAWVIWVLAILGVIVGLLNVTAEDT